MYLIHYYQIVPEETHSFQSVDCSDNFVHIVLFSDKVVEGDIIKWNVAVILSDCVAADDILFPCAEQETEELYRQVTDNNEEKEK